MGEGYISVKFRAPIIEMTPAEEFPGGAYIKNPSQEGDCKGATECRIELGHLKPGGKSSVDFMSGDVLATFPVVNHAGEDVPRWSCSELREELQEVCLR